jgi:hypothetical protein
MTGQPGAVRRDVAIVIGAWALMFALALAAALPQIDRLGLYYDEAFMAQQARDFVEPGHEHLHPASVRYTRLFGRPFPIRNAAYLGSLKSQLLIPALWIAGSDPVVLRVTTFATAWLSLALAMLWLIRISSLRVALVSGLLVATDPGFYFLGQFEWGPFTTNLLCRSAGLLALTIAFQATRPRAQGIAAAIGGVALGLGVFSRADFALIIAVLIGAAVIGHGRLVTRLVRERPRDLLIAGAAMLVCSAPMWVSAVQLIGSAGAMSDRGDLAFRARVFWSVLDGSQFHRLMQTGGLFDVAQTVPAPAGWFGLALAVSIVALAIELLAARRRDPDRARLDPRRFVWLATVGIGAAMLALPGAVRAHHLLNVMPFAQILVAFAFDLGWRRTASSRAFTFQRFAIAVALALLVLGQIRMIAQTRSEIAETGGRGRWSSGVNELAVVLEAEPGASAVSLDWGFHEPLMYLTDDVPLVDAIWTIRRVLTAGRPWIYEGDAGTRYLVHDEPFDLFGLGPLMLEAMRRQPAGTISIEIFRDGRGEVAFYAIRVLRPHRLVYTGRFTIE